MSSDAIGALADRLGVPRQRLAPFEGYDEELLAHLTAELDASMQREDESFDAALDEALRFVPKLLRGRAAKLLFPGGGRG